MHPFNGSLRVSHVLGICLTIISKDLKRLFKVLNFRSENVLAANSLNASNVGCCLRKKSM